MKLRYLIVSLIALLISAQGETAAQVNARLMQFPDVSETHIVFSYAGDLWVVPKTGGTANKLSSPEGQEVLPKFSPDGSKIAFTGNYDGNSDVYVIPSMGGAPLRVTHHGMYDRTIDWHPQGDRVLFSTSMNSGRQRFNQFYTVSENGGLPERLPLPYAEFGSYSPDGSKIAYTQRSRVNRTWKRYRGGMAADIWIYDLKNNTAEKIAEDPANDELPMWSGNKIFFLSDRDEYKRFNIWSYDLTSKNLTQLTRFTDFDVRFPSIGPSDLVFEAGGKLYLMDLATNQYNEVTIDLVTDKTTLLTRLENVSSLVQSGWISADGKRAVFEARGEIFSAPAEHGYIKNLTNSPGVAERSPAWSPDGKHIAYWSDRSGEYELTVQNMEDPGKETKLTSYGKGFRYQPYWSPDSKKIAFIDETQSIKIFDIDSKKTTEVDKTLWDMHGGLNSFSVDWSSDSRYMVYSRGGDNRAGIIFLYDTKENKKTALTSGFYNDTDPAFDPDGKYLYYLSNREFSPIYGDVDNSFLYANTTKLLAVPLTKETASPLAARNDEAEIKKDEKKDDDKKDKDDEKKEEKKEVKIDLDNFEYRAVELPIDAGRYRNLAAVSGKVIYHKLPNTGSDSKSKPIKYYDLEKREEKSIVDDADDYMISADGKKALIVSKRSFYVTDVAADQKLDKKLATDKFETTIDPMAEWKQIFLDAWRLERDYFYDPNMHGVDWNEVRERYGKMIDDCVTRWDVNYVIGEMIGELDASHTYRGGGDSEDSKRKEVGYLGVDWELKDGKYRIKKIIKGADWDIEVKSPFSDPQVGVKEGDYVLAVNGVDIDASKDPWAAFQGLSGVAVELTVNDKPSKEGAKKVVVETMDSEVDLRFNAWIENNRKRVDEMSGGKIGYIYVPSTGFDGQNQLVKMFAAQYTKPGLIIDERFNSGGQIPDRFIELLNRPPLVFWDVRHGKTWQWPPVAHFGPKAMLINGWSGSGGDAFPDYFKKTGLGPLIGERTWGGLIGISGVPGLIDGGSVTVPTFRMYNPNGEWFREGHGVDPDILVVDDPSAHANGRDPQLDRAISEIMSELQDYVYPDPGTPPYEDRTSKPGGN